MSTSNGDYNTDELEAPDWLNANFFTEVLVQYLEAPSLTVIDVKILPATAKGDHYASVMFRAGIEYSIQKRKFSKSLIVKTMPEQEGQKKEFLADALIFPTEIAMYTKVLPKFEEVLRAAGDETKFCAPCVYHSLEPRQVMIFEDLVPQGYTVIRNRSATLDELRGVFHILAKWHAVSHKLLKEQPEMFDKLKYDLTTVPNFLEQECLVEGVPNFLDLLGSTDSLKSYQKYFEPLRGNLIKRWVDTIREYRENRQENGVYVLCHGDFHLRNMMFKGDECMLLDFQMSYVGCMMNDVIYAMYMLLGPTERAQHYDELIYHYFDCFTKTLTKIGYQGKMPSLSGFRQKLFDKRYAELMLLTSFLPLMGGMQKGMDPAEFLYNKEVRVQLYNSEVYKQELEVLLPRMLHRGYFEDFCCSCLINENASLDISLFDLSKYVCLGFTRVYTLHLS